MHFEIFNIISSKNINSCFQVKKKIFPFRLLGISSTHKFNCIVWFQLLKWFKMVLWLNLEDRMLSKISQKERANMTGSHLHEDREGPGATRHWGQRRGRVIRRTAGCGRMGSYGAWWCDGCTAM